ncbi:MAG: hypothetical protein PUB61_08120, partial [Bacteroidales bacterium]|nr:hypothetical protein [Bacteroidales bacterium]
VQIECKSKSKLVLKFDFAEMQPILREAKVVQGERKTKRKRSFQVFVFPSRSLSYLKIVQIECKSKFLTDEGGG